MASTISAGTTSGTALNIQSDTTGNLAFKTGAANVVALTIDGSQNVTFANAVTYSGNIQGAVITATTNFAGSGSALTTLNASNLSSGTISTARLPTTGVNASTITAGTLAVAQGGTGAATLTANNVLLGNGTSAVQVVAPGSSGNILTSNGTTWASTAPAAGGVTSVATGNGLSGGTITSTGTLTVACPTFNTVGSYCFTKIRLDNNAGTVDAGSNYAVGSGNRQVQAGSMIQNAAAGDVSTDFSTSISGTWKYMGTSRGTNFGDGLNIMAVSCRVS